MNFRHHFFHEEIRLTVWSPAKVILPTHQTISGASAFTTCICSADYLGHKNNADSSTTFPNDLLPLSHGNTNSAAKSFRYCYLHPSTVFANIHRTSSRTNRTGAQHCEHLNEIGKKMTKRTNIEVLPIQKLSIEDVYHLNHIVEEQVRTSNTIHLNSPFEIFFSLTFLLSDQ